MIIFGKKINLRLDFIALLCYNSSYNEKEIWFKTYLPSDRTTVTKL